MEAFLNSKGSIIVNNMIKAIQENKDYLSEVDGAIGDGDHGINMNKGFTMCADKLKNAEADLTTALKTLGRTLLMEIGGSMGPLYGTFFIEMSKVSQGKEEISKEILGEMLQAALTGIQSVGNAGVGDKTLMDCLVPAVETYKSCVDEGKTFADALCALKISAEEGKESTKDLVAKIGRASRLGERSRGVLDAGATSCNLILQTMADSIIQLIN